MAIPTAREFLVKALLRYRMGRVTGDATYIRHRRFDMVKLAAMSCKVFRSSTPLISSYG